MKAFKRIIGFALLILLLTIAYVLFNTFSMKSMQIASDPVEKIEVNRSSIDHLIRAIKIKTISPENIKDFDSIQFDRFTIFLKDTYPLADSLLEHKMFNEYSHLYHWKGSNAQLKPVVMMAHLDVVPVIDENRQFWKEDPFGGVVKNDTIWGRGAIDDKVGVIGIMESIEYLLIEGFQPERDIYIAIGHDEEIGGQQGAKTIAKYLKEKGVQAEFVMDEGGSLTSGMVPGIEKDVAIIGIAEKGTVSFELSVDIEGGHSSMPAKETAIDVIANAVAKLKSNPVPPIISEPVEQFISFFGPEMTFELKMAFANKDLLKPLIIKSYASSPSTDAIIRTTTSPTLFNSGVKDNIIPLTAKATINFRIISGSSISEVKEYIRKIINDDRIKINESGFGSEPSIVSDVNSNGFKTINKTITQIYPGTVVGPYLMVGASDGRHFEGVSTQIFRFLPTVINKSNVKSFHGLNERIALSEFENAIRFYIQLIKNTSLE